MPSILLLELEGVLVDTSAMRRDALTRALDEEGIAPLDGVAASPDAGAVGGLGTRDAAADALARAGRAADETVLDLVTLRAERHFATLLGKGASLAPGARELVEDAASRARLALVTRARRREADFLLALASLDAAFECVVAAEDAAGSPKPSPLPYRRALDRLGRRRPAPADDALALEDSLPGIRAARAAGVRCVAVGALPAYEALEADADVAALDGQTLSSLAALVRRGEARAR